MRDILGVYVIDDDAEVFFEQEIYSQGSNSIDEAMLSKIIITIQKFADELGGGDVRKIEFGQNRVYMLGDKITNYKFILRSNQKVKQKRAQEILRDIKNTFIDTFIGNYQEDKETLMKLKSKFSDEIITYFEDPSDVSGFLKKM